MGPVLPDFLASSYQDSSFLYLSLFEYYYKLKDFEF